MSNSEDGVRIRRRRHSPVGYVPNSRRRYPISRRLSSSDSSEEEAPDDRERILRAPPNIPVVPKYRFVNFEQFKNWYGDGVESYAIEAYVARTGTAFELQDDIRQEQKKRSPFKSMALNQPFMELPSLVEERHIVDEDSSMKPEGSFIQRVRIRSQPVLHYLSNYATTASTEAQPYDRESSVTFIRPFRMLIFFQDKMKEALNVLEEKWAKLEKEQDIINPASSPISASTQQGEKEPRMSPIAQNYNLQSRPRVDDYESTEVERRDTANNAHERDVMDSIKALRDMRCYVGFVDDYIMPIYRFVDWQKGMPTKVRFDDLWLLFKPGQNIISTSKERIVEIDLISRRSRVPRSKCLFLLRLYQVASDIDDMTDSDRITAKWEPYQHVWRICSVTTPPDRLDGLHVKDAKLTIPPTSVNFQEDPDDDLLGRKSFQIQCFYLDYDGSSWNPVFTRFSIPPYDDEKDITSLPCYPLQYCDDPKQILTDISTMGQRFQNAIVDKRFYYSGMTLDRQPDGSSNGGSPYNRDSEMVITTRDRSQPFKRSARQPGKLIESEVVIDFEEMYMNDSSLRPTFTPLRNHRIYRYWTTSFDLPICVWDSADRSRLLYSIDDVVQVDDPVASLEAEQWIDNTSANRWHAKADVIAQAYNVRSKVEPDDSGSRLEALKKRGAVLDAHDLVLTPTRVCGYAFKEKGFFMLDLRKLQPIIHQRGVFESLKIPKEYKEMVRSLVSSHFEKKKIERLLDERSEGSIDQDIIQGKGKGLVILLHGVPGVGKTATAEAVAKENQKPLFTVTYGDLGTNPSELEETLESLFHLANRWDCVLLFDEADVFLAERSRTELKRNALVSGK